MKYPIDTNRYIESTRVLYGAKGEEVCRDYLIPAMNDAYRDGKAGLLGIQRTRRRRSPSTRRSAAR